MPDFIYNIAVFPLEIIIESVFTLTFKIFNNAGIAVCGVGVAVSVLTLPLYFMAEKRQDDERRVQKKLKPEIDNIKGVFKGDERYMLLRTFYRQNNYHPLYALRGSLSLLVQIPFFIAAYHFLSNLSWLSGTSFLFIKDLNSPDALFNYGGMNINILPIAMTLVNCLSAVIYTRGKPAREQIQLYIMAALFLILLYDSPASLVLYWTVNNVFSLVKNILQKSKHGAKIVYGIVCACSLFLMFYILFIHTSDKGKRAAIASLCFLVMLFPLFKKLFNAAKKIFIPRLTSANTAVQDKKTFIFSALIISLLSGLMIPSTIILSSVREFSFIPRYNTPMIFLYYSGIQALGIGLYLFAIYLLFTKEKRKIFCALVVLFSVIALLDRFVFTPSYGFLTPALDFSETVKSPPAMIALNFTVLAAALALCLYLLYTKYKFILYALQSIVLFAFVSVAALNMISISREFSVLVKPEAEKPEGENLAPVYTFSKTGQNLVIIMLDKAISGFVPYIFEEKPELKEAFSGFTYYPDCLSFARHTALASPALFGGYEYAPFEMEKLVNVSTMEKHLQAMRLLPALLSQNNFNVTVSNLPYVPKKNYKDFYPAKFEDTEWKYLDYYLYEHPELSLLNYGDLLKTRMLRFSFFNFVPLAFRNAAFDGADYLSVPYQSLLTDIIISNYAALYYLPETTSVTGEDKKFASIFVNELTHEPCFLEAPSYVPSNFVDNKGAGTYNNDIFYHVNIASLLLLGKWFDFLKENGVYDNSRIIIVSDHGYNIPSDLPQYIKLPNGEGIDLYNCLLMVKDFNSSGAPRTDNDFMTNADVPFFALDGLVDNPVNPFTGRGLTQQKADGIIMTTFHEWYEPDVNKNTFNIDKDKWLHVRGNIFEPSNWKRVKE